MVPCARKLTLSPTLRASSSNTRMNSAPNHLTLGLGLGHAVEQAKEAVGGVNVNEVGVELILEDVYDLFAFALAHKAVVYVDADELLADGLDEQRRDHGGVNAAGKCQKYVFVANLGADLFDFLVNESLGKFGRSDALHVFGTLVRIHPSSFRCCKRACVCLRVLRATKRRSSMICAYCTDCVTRVAKKPKGNATISIRCAQWRPTRRYASLPI